MNRLTHKNIAIQLDKDIESTITTSQNVSRNIYLKCSYLEDFLEEHNVVTLADYIKQVRREVVSELMNILNESQYMNRHNSIDKETLFKVLDQIQEDR